MDGLVGVCIRMCVEGVRQPYAVHAEHIDTTPFTHLAEILFP